MRFVLLVACLSCCCGVRCVICWLFGCGLLLVVGWRALVACLLLGLVCLVLVGVRCSSWFVCCVLSVVWRACCVLVLLLACDGVCGVSFVALFGVCCVLIVVCCVWLCVVVCCL